MGTNEVGGVHYHSDTEIVGSERMVNYSGPLSGPLNKRSGNKKTAKFNIAEPAGSAVKPGISTSDEEPHVEVILDVREDSVAVHSVKPAADDHEDHVEMTLLGKGLEKNQSPKGSSVVRTASARIKQVSQELKRLASFSKQAVAAPHPRRRFDRTQSAAAPALKGLKFISKTDGNAGWPAVEKKFDELTASSNGLLPRSRFGECIGMNKESKEFAGKLFDALARKLDIKEDSITKEQLNEFWAQISEQGFDSRLQTFFDMVDKDADGRITIEEVKEIISFSASANKLSNIQNQADEYAALIMEELDPDNLGHIMIDSLETLLLQGPEETAVRGKDSRNLSKMLSQKLKPTREHPLRRWCSDLKYFLQDNWKRVWVVTLWVGIMAGLFAYKYVQYRNKAAYEVMGHCVCMAKGAAETLKFNMALILLPVCRNTITLLRNKTKLGIVVPFDDNLNFHKVIAIGIGIGVGIHGISHLACDFPRIIHASSDKYELMKPFFGDDQPSNYWHFLKSLEGVSGIVMVVLMAIAFTLAAPCFRKGQLKLPEPLKKLTEPLKKLTGFNAFWYSHHLFIIVYVLLIIHGIYLYLTKEWYKKTTWMYLAVPLTLYAGERLVRALRSSIKPVKILKVALYPGNVLALHLSKPQGFRYHSGQYMFVKCAAVSPFEWHPFSITSAPGDNHLSVHIRIVGDWTRQLKTVFSQVCQPPPSGKSGLLRADHMQGADNLIFPKVLIDGPYGAPAQDYKNYEVVLLVGLGIGATPMISILKDIVNNIKAIEEEGEDMGALENGAPSRISKVGSGSGSSQLGLHNFKTKRAYFYWVTREQGSFDWFKGAMNEVAELDHNRVIEFHNYCTSVYEEGDARSALIHMLQSLSHAKNGVDIVSGTRVKSHFAKPNWREVYKRIALDHTNATVGVFYCGLPALANELRQLSHDFSHKTTTQFDFHKENF